MGLHVAVRGRLRGPISHSGEHALSSRLGGGRAQVKGAALRPDRATKAAADPRGSFAEPEQETDMPYKWPGQSEGLRPILPFP